MEIAQQLMEQAVTLLLELWATVSEWATSPKFYVQLGAIIGAVLVAFFVARLLRRRIPVLRSEPEAGSFYFLRSFAYRLRALVFPLLNIVFLGIAIEIAVSTVAQDWLIRLAQGLATVFLLYTIITRFIQNSVVQAFAKWVAIPIATLYVFGWLTDVTAYLEGVAFEAGNIRVSAYALIRTVLFGAILFWLGRISSDAGKSAIRKQEVLEVGTREVFAKIFEILLFIGIFLLVLQVSGIDLTTLAVFGGAVGVGIGFGLQQIASNFISGFIILIDRSITPGDFIELEDGRSGWLRELNMRYGVLETFDGKEIMVPNEQFITTSFTNWTHLNTKQRYPLEFQVAYSTDLDRLFEVVLTAIKSHPSVLSGDAVPLEQRPDIEIAGFGDSGIDILVEFWMEEIDDGKNRVGADLLYLVWKTMRDNDMDFPFPQREVRILNEHILNEKDTAKA